MPERIGILGGTFDPIHNGHLFVAEEARTVLGLERMILVPTGTPPHKSYPSMATAEERYEMTLLAAAGLPEYEATRIETDRPGNSYTLDTLREIGAAYPGTELFLVNGVDAVLDIMHWREPMQLIRHARLVVVSRPGYLASRLDELPPEIRAGLIRIETACLEISATDIRNRVREGRNIAFLLPDAVRCYIMKKELYLQSEGETH